MSEDPGVREFPGALADYASGVGSVLARGSIAVAVPILLLCVLLAVVVGGGIAVLVLASSVPAVAVGLWLELPSRLRERFG